jgi:sodium-dependent phosphate cotransporter
MGSDPATSHALPTARKREAPLFVRAILLVVTLYVFFVAINWMGGALKLMTESTVVDILEKATENPVIGLLLGILATSIIQSSSTTTSIVVGMAAFETISLRGAIPIIMGANIGTTVTNTIVSFAHVRRQGEFQRALAAGTVHDFFNVIAVIVLFPIEVWTNFLERSALWMKDMVIGTSLGELPGLRAAIKPVVKSLMDLLHYPWVSLVVALVVLFFALAMMVKLMRSIFIDKMARVVDHFLFRNAPAAFCVGIVFTILVQSSSVTTSLVVPLVGAGILSLEQIFPYTLGANIGTTVTAFLAAAALASGGQVTAELAGVGLTVALVHLLFNVFGIALIYPFRWIPIRLARWLGRNMAMSRTRVIWFLIIYFLLHIFPVALFLVI